MILVSFVLLYLAIVKKFEPLLLLSIAFGMLLTNLPGAGLFHEELFSGGHVHWEMFSGVFETEPGVKVKTCHECGKKVYADVAPLSEDGIEELGPGAEKPETETEQNPNTGAPVFAPAVILLSASAAFFKKR